MKRKISLLIAAMLMLTSATAAPKLSNELMGAAKSAVSYLSSGEYERLVTLLPFSGVAPGASEWERFARNYENLSGGKPSKALAYWRSDSWNIAVPVQAEVSGDTEMLVLISEDGSTFTGYRYATWGKVKKEAEGCKEVVWNE